MNVFGALYSRLIRSRWELGLVHDGLDGVFVEGRLRVDWIVNPFRDRWFADPFILDVTEDYVYVLAEEYAFKTRKGRIAKLSVNRRTLRIEDYTIVLETPTHLSFPSILRKDGRVFVYPESCRSGHLCLYEFDSQQDELALVKTICDDPVWDSVIVNLKGVPQLFTANKNDYSLDIYDWDPESSRFTYAKSILSNDKSSRMAGQLFSYKGKVYMPSQYCEKVYGGGVIIKEVTLEGDTYSFKEVKRIESPHPKRRIKLHTLNEYDGFVIIDVGGYDFPLCAGLLRGMVKRLKRALRK